LSFLLNGSDFAAGKVLERVSDSIFDTRHEVESAGGAQKIVVRQLARDSKTVESRAKPAALVVFSASST
jgi:hypothetical protein